MAALDRWAADDEPMDEDEGALERLAARNGGPPVGNEATGATLSASE